MPNPTCPVTRRRIQTVPRNDAGPLTGMTILVTRAADDAGSLRTSLEALGAMVLTLPALRIAPPDDFEPLDAALRRLADFDWIAFPSRHAVDAVVNRLAALGLPPQLPTRVAAVGPVTERSLTECGIPVDVLPEEATGAALASELIRRGVIGRLIFLPAGDRSRPELRTGLQRAGALIEEVIAYRTLRPDEIPASALATLRRRAVDIVTLASPSAIDNLVVMLGEDAACLHQTRLVCIGPTTAAAVHAHGFAPAAVATSHTASGLVEAITTLPQPENVHAAP